MHHPGPDFSAGRRLSARYAPQDPYLPTQYSCTYTAGCMAQIIAWNGFPSSWPNGATRNNETSAVCIMQPSFTSTLVKTLFTMAVRIFVRFRTWHIPGEIEMHRWCSVLWTVTGLVKGFRTLLRRDKSRVETMHYVICWSTSTSAIFSAVRFWIDLSVLNATCSPSSTDINAGLFEKTHYTAAKLMLSRGADTLHDCKTSLISMVLRAVPMDEGCRKCAERHFRDHIVIQSVKVNHRWCNNRPSKCPYSTRQENK